MYQTSFLLFFLPNLIQSSHSSFPPFLISQRSSLIFIFTSYAHLHRGWHIYPYIPLLTGLSPIYHPEISSSCRNFLSIFYLYSIWVCRSVPFQAVPRLFLAVVCRSLRSSCRLAVTSVLPIRPLCPMPVSL
jgi:hypothetical protein